MKRQKFLFKSSFKVGIGDPRGQAAEMVLKPGEVEGGETNRHKGSDQWLFVYSGTGLATVNGRRHKLSEGVLVLIEKDEEHEIRNTGREFLRTLNIYVPPAYQKDGERLPAGRSS